MPRTEAEMIAKAPIKVKLGDKEYSIPILTLLPSHDWRLKLDEAMAPIIKLFDPMQSVDSEGIGRGLTTLFIQFPETMADLLFAYSGESLPKDEIRQNSTEEQIATAFSRIMEVAYPLAQLKTAIKVARPVVQPAMARSLN